MATLLESLSRAEIARQPLNPQQCALVVIDIQEKLLPRAIRKLQVARGFMVYEGLR